MSMRETVAEPEFKTIAIFGALDKLEEELVALGSGLEPKGAWDCSPEEGCWLEALFTEGFADEFVDVFVDVFVEAFVDD